MTNNEMLTAKERTNIKYGFLFWSQSKFEKTEDIGFILLDKNTAEARRLNQSFEQFGSAEQSSSTTSAALHDSDT